MKSWIAAAASIAVASIMGCGGPARGPHLDPSLVATELAANPRSPYWRYRQAEIYIASGDAASAESELHSALEFDPDHTASLALLSRVWFESRRHEEAVRRLEAARETGSWPDELAVALALHYDALDLVEEAAEIVASVSDAEWSSVGSAITYLRLRGEGFSEAEDVARRALDADSKNATNHNNFGITLLYAGQPAHARKAFLEARELDPLLPGPYYNLAIVEHYYFFDTDRAREWFREYRELAADDPDDLAVELGVQEGTP